MLSSVLMIPTQNMAATVYTVLISLTSVLSEQIKVVPIRCGIMVTLLLASIFTKLHISFLQAQCAVYNYFWLVLLPISLLGGNMLVEYSEWVSLSSFSFLVAYLVA